MSDDKVNMALDDIIKLNKRKRSGKIVKRSTEFVRQARGRKSVSIRGRGAFARRRGVPANVGQRRGTRTRILQRRGVSSPSTNVSVVNNAATRRFVKKLVNKALRRMQATSTASVVDRGAVYADAALSRVSERSRGIRKRVVEIPSVVARRPRVRAVAQPRIEEPEQFVYQTVRVVREPAPTQMIRQRQMRPVYRGVGQRAAVRVVQNGHRAAVIPVREFVQQRSSQFPIQRNRVFTQQPVRTSKALVERNVYSNGNRRRNPRASVVYLNEQMSSRVQTPALSGVRFIKRKPNRQFVAYREDEPFDQFASTSIGGRGLKRKGRGFGAQFEY